MSGDSHAFCAKQQLVAVSAGSAISAFMPTGGEQKQVR
jgi:hypothetical protein